MGLFFTLATIILILLGVIIFSYGYNNSRRWMKGSKGEKLVAKYLKKLSKEYYVFNDVTLPVKRGNIDHIVVGPNGIFAIETKNISGLFIIDDDEWYYKSHYEVQKAESQPGKQIKNNVVILLDYLNSNGVNTKKFWINSIVALNNPNIIIEETPKHYDIVQPSEITKFITNTNKTLNRHTLKTIVNLLEPYSRFSNN